MGAITAIDLKDQAKEGTCSLDTALAIHFQSNHYPPLPLSLIPVAKRVIEKAQRGEWEARVRLPEGITFRGSTLAPVRECAKAWHLDAWIYDLEIVIDF